MAPHFLLANILIDQNGLSRPTYARNRPTGTAGYRCRPEVHYQPRIDGFVSIGADERGGEVLTRPLTFTGNRLLANDATSAAGSIRFELRDPKGIALKGLSLGESEWLCGNEIEHAVRCGESIDVGGLAGQPVRLLISLRDADLYSFQFADTPNTEKR